MNTLLQDLRYGLRMLLTQKGLSAVALLSLALGIGANTALFSIVDAMLLKMLPVKEPDRLVLFHLEEAGAEDLFRKIRGDLDMHGVQLSDHQIRAKMDEALSQARDSVRNA